MGAVKVQTLQLSVERGAAHAERLGRRGDVAIGARKCPLQHPALRGGKVFGHCSSTYADNIRCGQRLLQACLRNSERQTSRTGCPNDKIVLSTAIRALAPLSATGTTRMRALGYARRKYSASIRVAASFTAIAMRLTKFSIRSARQDDTSSAATRCPS